jgi:hypothetical protein
MNRLLQRTELSFGLEGSVLLDDELRHGVVVRSPFNIVYVPGRHGWECPCPPGTIEHRFVQRMDSVVLGFEMGFAAATRDPWDGRCKLEVLMVEDDQYIL